MLTLIGFLRGINVGGHHKVPMPVLIHKLTAFGLNNVRTLLNTGNIVFESKQSEIQYLESQLESFLSEVFDFSIPVILRNRRQIIDLVESEPFRNLIVDKDIRLYASFLKNTPDIKFQVPYYSADKSYRIISIEKNTILSVLDLKTTNTSKGMDDLEKLFGKNITTRNWNTIKKIAKI